MTIFLAADIGASKTDLALFNLAGPGLTPLFQSHLVNNDFSSPEALLAHFISKSNYHPEQACLAVAAVVRDGRAMMTNRSWHLEGQALTTSLKIRRVELINDLTALAAALPVLSQADLITLQPGNTPVGKIGPQVRAVIAPGTGLGQGFFIDAPPFSLARGSEGGHASFAPINEFQHRLLQWLQGKNKAVSVEQVCSGRGLPNLYLFCRAQGTPSNSGLGQEIAQARDQTPLIIQGALAACPCCRQAVKLFLEILGAEAGNLALKLACDHGLFLGGGILPRLYGKISFAPLLAAFHNKDKMTDLLSSIPVHLITRKDAALLGAAAWGRSRP
mgnify:FL=1